eukprot:TRINITY_DN2552_c0_g1_i1.p1 TRINITY_DN2552_c0_g1~~TRINITY_DN2552_c0_g1_i1.p1  ORF type:complete len:212 (+),score=47.38 TRINITY_DN2552_c0_g1_i1:75-710(+)
MTSVLDAFAVDLNDVEYDSSSDEDSLDLFGSDTTGSTVLSDSSSSCGSSLVSLECELESDGREPWKPFPDDPIDVADDDVPFKVYGGAAEHKARLHIPPRVGRDSVDGLIEAAASRSEYHNVLWRKVRANTYVFGSRRVLVDNNGHVKASKFKGTSIKDFMAFAGPLEVRRNQGLQAAVMMLQHQNDQKARKAAATAATRIVEPARVRVLE